MTLIISNTYNFAANKKFDKVSNVSGNKITLNPLTNTKAGQWMLLWDAWTGIYDLIYINSIDPVNNCVYTKYPPRNSYSPSNGYVILTEIIYDHDSVVIDTNGIVTTNNIINDNGGIVAIFTNSLTINGKIDVSGKGFKGGASVSGMYDMYGNTGYGPKGGPGVYRAQNGSNATQNTKSISILLPGSGGGSGGVSQTWGNGTATSGYGGNGGGCVLLICKTLTMNSGIINTSGQNGGSPLGYSGCAGWGGIGADGSVIIYASTQNLTSSTITQTAYSQSSTLVLPDWNDIANKYLFQDGTEIKKYVDVFQEITGGVASAKSSYGTYTADKAIDNDINTYWQAPDANPSWWQINFGQLYKVSQIGIHYFNDLGTVNIETSLDGVNFTVQKQITGRIDATNDLTYYDFNPEINCRYVRINYLTNNGNWKNLNEFKAKKKVKEWSVIGTAPVTKDMFDQHGMTDLSIIDNNAIQQLTSDTPELLCWTDETGTNVTRQTNITAVPLPQLLLPVEDIEVGEIESVKVNAKMIGGISTVNAIPAMTSATNPSGEIILYGTTSSQAIQAPFDENDTTFFNGYTYPSGFGYKFPSPKIIGKYTVRGRADLPNQSPKDWTFEGSNDGVTWTQLDKQTGITNWSNNISRDFIIENPASYQYYRIWITALDGGGYPAVSRLAMFETIAGNTDIKIIVSGDNGGNWKGKNGLIDISDLTQVKANGFTPDELNTLNKEELDTLFPNGKARFAFYLEQEKSTDIVQIDSLKINEKVYTMTPSIENLSVLYELLESEKPTIYVSRDDGINWKEVKPDTLTKLDDLPEGNKLRVKIVLQNGQELYGLSYSWI